MSLGISVVQGSAGEDRAWVCQEAGGTWVVVADGAGGVGGGSAAAERVVRLVRERVGEASVDWARALEALDAELQSQGAETTAVILEVRDGVVRGASVGDSGAWMLLDVGVYELTMGQSRARLGSGRARAWEIGPVAVEGRVLAATDGLFGYASQAQIERVAGQGEAWEVAARLVRLVALEGERFRDDVAVVVLDA